MKNICIFIVLSMLSFSCNKRTNKIVSVHHYGALGDGVRDDTRAIQNAINASAGVLVLEPKTYKISSSLYLKSPLRIKGNGATLLLSEKSKYSALVIHNNQKVTLSDFSIKGQSKIATNPKNNSVGSFLIDVKNCTNIKLINITLRDHAFTASHFSNVVNLKIQDCTFKDIGYKSPNYTRPKKHYDYDGIFVGGDTYSNNITISNCIFFKIGPGDGDGIHFQTTKEKMLTDVTVTNCLFDQCAARGIKMQSGSNIKVKNNIFKKCNVGVGISMSNNVYNVDILDNDFNHVNMVWGTNGLWKVTATNINFSHNTVKNAEHVYRTSGPSLLKNSIISKNIVDSLETYFIDGRLENLSIKDNKITNYGLSLDKSYYMAMLIADGSKHVTIQGNEISTSINTISAIYVKPTVTDIIIEDNKISIPQGVHNKTYSIHFTGKSNREVLKKNTITLTKK